MTEFLTVVLAVLILDRCDAGYAYRGQEGMVRRTGLSRRTLQRAVRSIAARTDGPFVVLVIPQGKKKEGGGRAPNHYVVEFRATQAHRSPAVSDLARPPDAQDGRALGARTDELVRQTAEVGRQNDGGLSVIVAQDLGTDLGSHDLRSDREEKPAAASAAGSYTQPSAGTRRRSEKLASTAPDARHAEVAEFYLKAFEQSRGEKPLPLETADNRAVEKLLRKCEGDVPRACRIIGRAFREWRGPTITIREIARNPSEFIGVGSARSQRVSESEEQRKQLGPPPGGGFSGPISDRIFRRIRSTG